MSEFVQYKNNLYFFIHFDFNGSLLVISQRDFRLISWWWVTNVVFKMLRYQCSVHMLHLTALPLFDHLLQYSNRKAINKSEHGFLLPPGPINFSKMRYVKLWMAKIQSMILTICSLIVFPSSSIVRIFCKKNITTLPQQGFHIYFSQK